MVELLNFSVPQFEEQLSELVNSFDLSFKFALAAGKIPPLSETQKQLIKLKVNTVGPVGF